MRRTFKVSVAFLLSFIMVFTLGVSAYSQIENLTSQGHVYESEDSEIDIDDSEIGEIPIDEENSEENPNQEEEKPQESEEQEEQIETPEEEVEDKEEESSEEDNEESKEEPKSEEVNDEIENNEIEKPEELPDETENPEDIIKDEENTVAEDVYEEEIEEPQIGEPSIYVDVTTDKDLYEFGDTLIYNISLINDGEVDLENLTIIDDLNGAFSLDSLKAGEEKVITKEYYINPDSNLEEIENNVEVTTEFNEEYLVYGAGFVVGFAEYFERYEAVNQIPQLRMMTVQEEYEDTIEVDKTASRITPGCRLYEVVLDITGTPPPDKPVDVVLVIDRSGSMRGKPINDAKKAAKQFANNVLGGGNPNGNRIAVVSYASSAGTNLSWSNNLNQVENAINGLTASGRTNIQDGFIKAETQIDNARANATKAVVLLSDGVANERVHNPPRPYSSPHNINTAAAYQKGEDLQSKAEVFTIGLGINSGSVAEDTLIRAAQTGNYYDAPDSSDLSNIYNQISQQLSNSATNAVVVDKIGDNFDLLLSSLPTGATYDPNTREITWNIGTIVNGAQLKYIVQAKPSFSGGPADTNEYAELTYTDVNGNTGQTKEFPKPEVNVPAPLSVDLSDATIIIGNSIDLGTGIDENGENYMSPITGGDGDGTYTYEWRKSGESNIISTDKNPNVSPEDTTQYELTVIDSNGCKAIATMVVTVEDPKGSITITKVVQNPKNPNQEFDIFINGANGKQYTVTLKNGETKTIENLELGAYVISEIVPMNYKLIEISNKNINLTQENLEASTTVTNKPDNDGWFYDDDDRINKFKVGVIPDEDNGEDNSQTQTSSIESLQEAVIPNDPGKKEENIDD